ncbi:DNA polymerase IV [Cytophagales bacterium RKSG123]|nr:DNA polymerase IV [Xanthovirga aplysinae]
MDLDTFFVSCERLINPSLQGKPIIIGGTSDRGVVASCSYEARYYGVHSAMPVKYARQRCPDAIWIRGDMEMYSQKSTEVSEIIAYKAPLFEKASIDEFYLDISGMDRFFGSYQWTIELRELIVKESGLPISFGLSANKTVAKIATSEGKPNGKKHVPPPEIQPFLNPLSISKIPMIGQASQRLLFRVGIRRIKTLAETPVEILEQLFGKNGRLMHKKANGIDHSAVISEHEAKSLSTEHTFQKDSMDIIGIKALLTAFSEKLCYQLRKENKVCSVIAVKIRYNNFDTHSRQCKIPYSASDNLIIERAKELFDKIYERRMRIRLIGLRLSGLAGGGHQINLFDDTHKKVALLQATDQIRHRFGKYAIQRASAFNALK